jgi:hypothetical protein
MPGGVVLSNPCLCWAGLPLMCLDERDLCPTRMHAVTGGGVQSDQLKKSPRGGDLPPVLSTPPPPASMQYAAPPRVARKAMRLPICATRCDMLCDCRMISMAYRSATDIVSAGIRHPLRQWLAIGSALADCEPLSRPLRTARSPAATQP